MAEKTTFIIIDRNILEWRWFKKCARTFQLFVWLLLKANIKDHAFHKTIIPRGSLATSYESMADACGMSVSAVRRIIQNLEETGEIEREVKDHYQIIKVVKYDEYQGVQKQQGKRQQKEQPVEQPVEHPNGNDITILNNNNNGDNGNKYSAPLRFPCGATEKPEWMTDELWEKIKFRTVANIPGIEQGFHDTYIDYVEELHKQGKEIS